MQRLDNIVFGLSFLVILFLGFHFGVAVEFFDFPDFIIDLTYLFFSIGMGTIGLIKARNLKQFNVRIFNGIIIFISFISTIQSTIHLFFSYHFIHEGSHLFILFFLLLVGLSRKLSQSLETSLHPALVFVLSFALLIFFGSLLLMLPGATTKPISYLDAIFTSTSAVTVTGLAVLDTGKDFTLFGHVIILILIQFGGLGVLTFSNLFAMLFSGGSTFRDQIAMTDFINSENLASTKRLLLRIVGFVFLTEMAGAFFIYLSIQHSAVIPDKIFFAVFHSISAFCNAGFSTFGSSLLDPEVQYNYPLHLCIAFMIILGGIGFNIKMNYGNLILFQVKKIYYRLLGKKITLENPKKIIKINTILVVATTAILLLVGMIGFWFIESKNTLSAHESWFGKFTVSFFNSVTTRTAGFNNVDMGTLLPSTVLMMIFLMWVGASPGSTGGGIKTTTFAVTFLNLRAIILGKDRIEFRHKEISVTAVQRATVIILLSLLAVGASVFLLSVFDPKVDVLKTTFECFSAFGTVGLSLNLTPYLSEESRIVLIVLMFLGRVSLLTFLMAIFRQFFPPKQVRYQYPKEEIFIN